MKLYNELKTTMEIIQKKMSKAYTNKTAHALKESNRPFKEFGFTAGIIMGALTMGRN